MVIRVGSIDTWVGVGGGATNLTTIWSKIGILFRGYKYDFPSAITKIDTSEAAKVDCCNEDNECQNEREPWWQITRQISTRISCWSAYIEKQVDAGDENLIDEIDLNLNPSDMNLAVLLWDAKRNTTALLSSQGGLRVVTIISHGGKINEYEQIQSVTLNMKASISTASKWTNSAHATSFAKFVKQIVGIKT